MNCRALLALLGLSAVVLAQGPSAKQPDTGPSPGHSHYGPAFNDGPRQRAYHMSGTGHVRFDVTSKSEEAKKFVRQGIGQVHGFWYLEAERSFRQALALDSDCAMAYWGLAMLHRDKKERGEVFIKKAVERKAKASPREAAWIDGLNEFITSGKPEKDRFTNWLRAWDRIARDYPEDIEAKAFLVWLHWEANGRGVPVISYETVDALAKQIFEVEPDHPAQHYVIHLWDNQKAARALHAAARCGIGSPDVAHMWHMPGHIYDKLGRFADAAWQFEAAGRVDHAYMARDQIMPYSIHNYAHNQEWLCRTLMHLGRARDALAIARSLAESPRHPQHNQLVSGAFNTAGFGRARLLEVLVRFELWDDLLALSATGVLDETDIPSEQAKWFKFVGRAHAEKGDLSKAKDILARIDAALAKHKQSQKEAGQKAALKAAFSRKPADQVKKARESAEREFNGRIETLESAGRELKGWLLLAEGKGKEAVELLAKGHDVYGPHLARAYLAAGLTDKAEEAIRKEGGQDKVLPLAALVEVLAARGKKDEAAKEFAKLRTVAGRADPDLLAFGRLAPLAQELQFPIDWRTPEPPAKDIGPRPDLDTLGPLRWTPLPAPAFALLDAAGKTVRLDDYRGRPILLVFHLGGGCPHCVEQLNKFAPLAGDFAKQGITILAVSNEAPSVYASTDASKPNLPLLSDTSLAAFKAYRCYDDFEGLPLHGTFLIDGNSRIRWQDISFEPFREPEFLLQEAKRLLSMP
jgi:peroxiredoxin